MTFETVLVRCLDSEREPAKLSEILSRLSDGLKLVDAGILLPRQLVFDHRFHELLNGFDELWFLSDTPARLSLESDVSLTSDGVRLVDGVPKDLERAMFHASSLAVLGDGCGLNIATWDEALVGIVAGR
jgi:hypothetical protein